MSQLAHNQTVIPFYLIILGNILFEERLDVSLYLLFYLALLLIKALHPETLFAVEIIRVTANHWLCAIHEDLLVVVRSRLGGLYEVEVCLHFLRSFGSL